jgi:hypothetical protein
VTGLLDFARSHGRPAAVFVALWLFGISTTILLVALWGRSVAADEVTLTDSAEAVLASGYVHDRIESWVADGIAAGAGATSGDIGPVVEQVVESDEMDAALDGVVADLVEAALAPDGDAVRIDVAALLEGVVPVAADALLAAGYEVEAAGLGAVLDRAPDIVLAEADLAAISGAATTTHGVLTWASLIGAALVFLAGGVAIALSDDRAAQLRDLGTRVALSAVGFAVFLRVGAWATDPAAGRSPVVAGGSVILGSNGDVPLVVGGIALVVVAGAATVVLKRRRNQPDPEPTEEVPVLEPV